jgi:hypothetical protein
MANNCDPYYTEAFETREEVERFINYLLQKTDEAWPSTENSIIFSSQSEEVVRLDKEGFHYKGEFIADAGEAHRLMVAFLRQQTKLETEGPTDEELWELYDQRAGEPDDWPWIRDYARAVLALCKK